uniref:Uncharacterized protein n=1 Tax=Percolomonas cosmopolitus TaxID=63605 RepID=A0A7S1KP71_9EUKA|mmetsp:Transcript_344/g.1272  ORF Transcript_344/g.1272 Transcript_344/m.1272 type:complete len:563 (+) Transcript_344:1-1689(+)
MITILHTMTQPIFLAFSTAFSKPSKKSITSPPANHVETHPINLTHKNFQLPDTTASIHKFLFGQNHVLVLYENGELYASGDNSHGELGTGTTEPLEIGREWHLLAQNVHDCALGLYHTVYLTREARVYALGRNNEAQLGVGSFGTDVYEPREVKVGQRRHSGSEQSVRMKPLPASDQIVHVSCGAYHTVLQAHNGICYAFGRGIEGQLGNLGHLRKSVKTEKDIKIEKDTSSSNGNDSQEETLAQQKPTSSRLKSFDVCHDSSNPMSIYLQFQPTPKPIKCLDHSPDPLHQRRRPFTPIVQIGCGENYTALLSIDGRVLAAGEGRTGVLGKGKCSSHNYLVEQVQFSDGNDAASILGGNKQDTRQRLIDVQIEMERIPPPPKPKIVDQEDEEEIRDEDCTFKMRTSFGMELIQKPEGEEDTLVEEQRSTPPDIIQMANGWNHSLLLSSTGDLYASGLNLFGQCGLNHRRTQTRYAKVPKSKAFAKEQILDIGCGNTYSAVLTASGRLYVMGRLPGDRTYQWGSGGDYILPTELQYFARRGFAVERMFCGARDLVVQVVEMEE